MYYIYHKSLRRGYVYISQFDINNKEIIFKIQSDNTYNYINLEITPIYINNKDIIELPRNTYLEFKYENQSISFSKPNKDYNYSKIEIDCYSNLSIILNNISEYSSYNEFGKFTYLFNDDSLNYNIRLISNNSENILIKYITSKNDLKDIKISETFSFKPNRETNTSFIFTHEIFENIDKITKKSYLIRLYNVLDYDYEDPKDMDHIFEQITPNTTLRKDVKNLTAPELEYNFDFKKLDNGHYLIIGIAEVYYNDNVEYFSIGYDTFKHKPDKIIKFDKSWIVVLVIVLFIFVIISLYLIKSFIYQKKEKKSNISEDRGKFLKNKITNI